MFAITLALAITQSTLVSAGPYELTERLRELDLSWTAAPEVRRKVASANLKLASKDLERGSISEACLEIDLARYALDGSSASAADAVSLRPLALFIEPGATARIAVRWAYRPKILQPVEISIAGQVITTADPLKEKTFGVDPWAVNPELKMTQETGYLLPVEVGGRPRHVYLSIVKHGEDRIAMLAASTDPAVGDVGKFLSKVAAEPETQREDAAYIQYLLQGEQLLNGRARLENLDELYYVKEKDTVFHVAFPKGDTPPSTLVVVNTQSPAGVSAYFERNGRGMWVKAALKRGWVFASAHGGPNSAPNVAGWLARARGLSFHRIVLVSEGGDGMRVAFSGSPVQWKEFKNHGYTSPLTAAADEMAEIYAFLDKG